MKDSYKEVKTFNYPNAVVRVHIPDLTEEERQKRMKDIYKAVGCLTEGTRHGKEVFNR